MSEAASPSQTLLEERSLRELVPDLTRFDDLRREWLQAKAESEAFRLALRHLVATGWERKFRSLSNEYHALVEQGRWVSGPVDLLAVIKQSRRETHHCSVLAWLLDPTNRHGLGTRFLEELLKEVVPAEAMPDALRGCRTACEVVRPESRADIVIFTSTLTVVIEAKVDAGEQEDQCDRLFRDYGSETDPHFVFLTPHAGRKPTTATGDAAEAFRIVSFRRVRELLQLAASAGPGSESPGGQTVQNYLMTLDREFR